MAFSALEISDSIARNSLLVLMSSCCWRSLVSSPFRCPPPAPLLIFACRILSCSSAAATAAGVFQPRLLDFLPLGDVPQLLFALPQPQIKILQGHHSLDDTHRRNSPAQKRFSADRIR